MKTRFYQILAVSALCLAAAALAVSLWSSVRAQEGAPEAALAIPTTLNYQGYLREPDGSLTTGTFDITAKIYDLAADGNELYVTTLPGVTVRDGLFNIVLGDNPPLLGSVFANAPLYIGISIDGGAELIPRQRLHAVPWAFQASTLINNAVAQTVQGLTSNGDVTVNGATALNGNATVTGNTSIGGSATISGDTAMNGNATITGNVLITGTLAHPGETFVGPHFLNTREVVRSWGACNVDGWQTVDVTNKIPAGATAVILEYKAIDSLATDSAIWIRKGDPGQSYRLAYIRAATIYDDAGWGGQGTFPVKDDGATRSFQYFFENDIQGCEIYLIGYFK